MGKFNMRLNRKSSLILLILLVTVVTVSMCLFFTKYNKKNVAGNSPETTSTPRNEAVINNENEVVVNNAKEFVEALKTDSTIKLMPGDYDLNKLGQTYSNQYFKEGKIFGIKDITILGSGEQQLDFITFNTSMPVLSIENCENIIIRNLNMGHDPKLGETGCTGDVVFASNCRNLVFDECILFGCGMQGLNLNMVDGLEFKNSVIKECSSKAMYLYDSSNLKFDNSKFFDNGNGVITYSCENVKISNCSFTGDGYAPVISDNDRTSVLTDEGTLPGELNGYASRYFDSFEDWLSKVSLENALFANKLFYDENLKIYESFKGGMSDSLRAVNVRYEKAEKLEEPLWEVIIKLEKEEKVISSEDISQCIRKLSDKTNMIENSSLEQYVFKVLSNNKTCVLEAKFKKADLVSFLSDNGKSALDKFSQVTIKSSAASPSKLLGKNSDYINGSKALELVGQLVDIKKEVKDPDYVNGGDFQVLSYKGAQEYSGQYHHFIELEQKLPLLGDFIHYNKIGTFKVSLLTREVLYSSEAGEDGKVEKITEDMKQVVYDYCKSKGDNTADVDIDKSVFILLNIGSGKKVVEVELFNNEGVCGAKRYYISKQDSGWVVDSKEIKTSTDTIKVKMDTAGYRPIIVYPSNLSSMCFVLGGEKNGKWVNVKDIGIPESSVDKLVDIGLIKGGEHYKFYADEKYIGEGTGTKAKYIISEGSASELLSVDVEPCIKFGDGFAIGINGDWNAVPSVPERKTGGLADYRENILKAGGIGAAEELKEVLVVDLDGDGNKEVIYNLVTGKKEDNPADTSVYSRVILEKTIKGAKKYFDIDKGAYKYKIYSYDINGDGIMEILLDGWAHEEGFVHAFSVKGEKPVGVLLYYDGV